jgi:hypothetical protein
MLARASWRLHQSKSSKILLHLATSLSCCKWLMTVYLKDIAMQYEQLLSIITSTTAAS